MIHSKLLNPDSIVIVGASNDTSKPGGKVLHNIMAHNYSGKLIGVNPKETEVQGVPCFKDCTEIPDVDLAIIAIAAPYVEAIIQELAYHKNCKGFILFSAGFSETGDEGEALENRCVNIVNDVGGSLIGPNCIGVLTGRYKGVFAGPVPEYDPMGCDCVSASGATMVYMLEAAIPVGLKMRDIFSVGNSAQIGVEDILEYWDETFDAQRSSRIKLLYVEQIRDPKRFLKHARSLVRKGCRLAAIKSGSTHVGSRAVSSHTGALAGSNAAVSALFRKAGILRCASRLELVYVAAIFSIKPLKGNRIAVITHAGGPGIMLTDVLINGGMKVPRLTGTKAEALLEKLFPGSSVSNPIDFLATGNAQQLGAILDAVENDFDEIDGSVVVFGTTGMWRVDDAYKVLHEKIVSSKKPIFPILPSAILAAEEVEHFLAQGHVNFNDEVSFGYVLSRIQKLHEPYEDAALPVIDKVTIRQIIDNAHDGYLPADNVFGLFNATGIKVTRQQTVTNINDAVSIAQQIGFPIVMKVSGPVHKSDVGGVVLGINNLEEVAHHFERLMQLKEADGVVMQQQLKGIEIYLGAKKEPPFGHQILCGLGGIFVEVFKDVSTGLSPVGKEEAQSMIQRLRSYPIIKGTRGKEGVNEELIMENILRLSALLAIAPEIEELDINPLLGNSSSLIAVDGRILLKK